LPGVALQEVVIKFRGRAATTGVPAHSEDSDAERDGRNVRSPTELVFQVRDGRITEAWSHHYDQDEFDEFWA
jgi:ketosteroid isomerase-like protein